LLHFGIKKVDDVFCQDKKVYIFCKGRKNSGYAGSVQRFCEYKLLKNLLESGESCGVIHMSFGDTFKNMTHHFEGWKQKYITTFDKEADDFDYKASMHIIKYKLYEFKVYNNNPTSILEYIREFLLGKVKYIFITNLSTLFDEEIRIYQEIFKIAEENNITFIIRTGTIYDNLPNNMKDSLVEFNKDKDSGEATVSCLDKDGNLKVSEIFKIYKNDGIGYIE
jgi:hypothetical protein